MMTPQSIAVASIPAPDVLKTRLNDLLVEVDMTRKLLRLSERKQKHFGSGNSDPRKAPEVSNAS